MLLESFPSTFDLNPMVYTMFSRYLVLFLSKKKTGRRPPRCNSHDWLSTSKVTQVKQSLQLRADLPLIPFYHWPGRRLGGRILR